MTKKVQNFSFLVFSSMMFIWGYIIPSFLVNYGKESWIYILIGLGLSILVIVIPKKENPNNIFIKILESVYLFISIIFLFYMSLNVLSNFLLFEYGVIGPLLPLIGATIIIEFNGRESIFSVSTIFFILGLLLLIVPFFLNLPRRKFDLCLPIEFEPNFLKAFIVVFIPLDLMHLYHLDISKKELAVSTTFILILCALYTISLMSIFGEIYLKRIGFPGFMLYDSTGASTLFREIDFIFLYLIPISIIFTAAFRLNIIRENLKLKKSKIQSIAMGIIFLLLSISVNISNFDLFPVIFSLLLILFLWRLYGLFKRNKKAL